MSDVTRILTQIESGDPSAAELLLPLVYEELRKLAAGHMANESPFHSLNATGLVHEAYLKLVSPAGSRTFANRRHFFSAAAEAMRRILIDSARRKHAEKRGSAQRSLPLDPDRLAGTPADADTWIDLNDAVTALEEVDTSAAELAKLRLFAGLSVEEAGDALEMSRAMAFRIWTYARAWLAAKLADRSANS